MRWRKKLSRENNQSMYEEKGLKIAGLKMETISRDFAAEHYKEHIGKSFL